MASVSFEDLALVEDIRNELATFLDRPSLFALSLTSRFFFDSLYFKYFRNGYNIFQFVDGCARYGYVRPLEEAVRANRKALDLAALELALENSQLLAADFIFSNLADSLSPQDSGKVANLCARLKQQIIGGEEEMANVVERGVVCPLPSTTWEALCVTPMSYYDCAKIAARCGNVDLGIHLMGNSGEEYGETSNVFLASMSARLTTVLDRFCADPTCPTPTEVNDMFIGAFEGGNVEVLRYAMAHGAVPRWNTLSRFADLYPLVDMGVEMLGELETQYPSEIQWRKRSIRINACHIAMIDVLKWLEKFPEANNDGAFSENLLVLFHGRDQSDRFFREDRDRYFRSPSILHEEGDRRIACAKYYYEEKKTRWLHLSANIESALKWADMEQMRWILCRTINFVAGFSDVALMNYLREVYVADLNLVALILENGGSISSGAIIETVFVENNLELLRHYSSYANAFDLISKETFDQIIAIFVNVYLSQLPVPEGFLKDAHQRRKTLRVPEKERLRYHNFSEVLRFFASIGFSVKPDSPLKVVKKRSIIDFLPQRTDTDDKSIVDILFSW